MVSLRNSFLLLCAEALHLLHWHTLRPSTFFPWVRTRRHHPRFDGHFVIQQSFPPSIPKQNNDTAWSALLFPVHEW